MAAILLEMGLPMPPERKVIDPPNPGPAPRPVPEPAPEPAPPPAPAPAPDQDEDDGFFDDDFFDDDRSFDEIVEEMDADFDETVAEWDRDFEETVKRWDEARKAFLEREDEYAAGTIPLQTSNLQAGGRYTVNLRSMRPGEHHVIPGALDLPARDQAARGTCTAFSGVRALEAILVQNGIRTDLSEEHFYYLSKPGCWQTPCGRTEEGGSVDGGLIATRSRQASGVLTEQQCPYAQKSSSTNITNSPLQCAGAGLVRAGRLSTLATYPDILNALRNNQPVVVGFTLSRSYYRNRGVVRHFDPANDTAAEGRDAGGHANLLVGYVRLPPSLSREGDYCVITANSWNDGWGRGGHACLTEKWLREHVGAAAALQSVQLTDQGLAQLEL